MPPLFLSPSLKQQLFIRLPNAVWIDRTIEGNQEGTAAGLLEECLLDDDEGKCERFSNALSKLDSLLGVGAGEQF